MDPLLEKIHALNQQDCDKCSQHVMLGGGTRGDGDWNDAGERIINGPRPDGTTITSAAAPLNAVLGQTFAIEADIYDAPVGAVHDMKYYVCACSSG